MPSYFAFSLGCKVNAYEVSALGAILNQHGYHKIEDAIEADVIILNTCSVTGTADQKSRQHISKFRKLNPKATYLVMGCYSQRNAQKALELGADIVLGGAEREIAYSLIEQFQKDHQKKIQVKENVRHSSYDEWGIVSYTDSARAYLKIQDGCDNFCSYCLIPMIRGNSRSRRPGEVIKEAQSLVDLGYKEIIITGIHIGGYGKDLGDGSFLFSDLIERIVNEVPNLYRLRISSIEESEIDEKLIHLLARHPNIAAHLHIPLQSGSDSVLKRMKRKYDTATFLKTLERIRSIHPDIAITTDIIVGFPGEREEEFLETMAFAEKAQFAEIHVFPFSSRPGTYAATLKDTDPQIKKERAHRLLALSKKLRKDYEKKFFGQECEILFEDYNESKHLASGHSSNYLLVSIPSDVSLHGTTKKIIYKETIASD